MNLVKIAALPFRYRPWHYLHARLILKDLVAVADQPAMDSRSHLQAAIDWLCHAQDMRLGQRDEGGVAAGWSFEDGWLPSYPETTGYIIETFSAAAELLDSPDLKARAQRMIDWELSIQNGDGSFPGHFGEAGSRPVIFNTGQIMHGMVAGYIEFGRNECLDAAVRAGRWMVACQDEDGCWRRNEHNGVPHTYNTRATWALLRTGLLSGEAGLVDGAKRNLDWSLSQQTESGWFATNGFTPGQIPFTHTIAYAIRGLLESGVLVGDERYIQSARTAALALAQAQRPDGWLAGTYADGWKSSSSYCCLTGVAQMCLNWLRLSQEGGSPELIESARRGLEFLKRNQRLNDSDAAVRGGIAGSAPIWGSYSRFEYPNWATKFYADALMMEMADITIPPVMHASSRPSTEAIHV